MSRREEREAAGAVFAVKVDLVYVMGEQDIAGGVRLTVGKRPQAAQRMHWADAVRLATRLRKAFLGVKVVRFRKRKVTAGQPRPGHADRGTVEQEIGTR